MLLFFFFFFSFFSLFFFSFLIVIYSLFNGLVYIECMQGQGCKSVSAIDSTHNQANIYTWIDLCLL